MPRRISLSDISGIETLLAAHHAKHNAAKVHLEKCAEPKCVEAKWALEWLKVRLPRTGQTVKSADRELRFG